MWISDLDLNSLTPLVIIGGSWFGSRSLSTLLGLVLDPLVVLGSLRSLQSLESPSHHFDVIETSLWFSISRWFSMMKLFSVFPNHSERMVRAIVNLFILLVWATEVCYSYSKIGLAPHQSANPSSSSMVALGYTCLRSSSSPRVIDSRASNHMTVPTPALVESSLLLPPSTMRSIDPPLPHSVSDLDLPIVIRKVSIVSRFMTSPQVPNMNAVIRIPKYLKNAPSHGSDLVTWRSKKQLVVAYSALTNLAQLLRCHKHPRQKTISCVAAKVPSETTTPHQHNTNFPVLSVTPQVASPQPPCPPAPLITAIGT
uniref:Uncharacterized protein n=1 Tax=Fagus sylvatica TaxID=28930 RepID=A0A2N9GU14_FAGSY